MALTEDGRAGIIATHAMSSLVDGLACNAEHAQTACGKALYRLAKHGLFPLLTTVWMC